MSLWLFNVGTGSNTQISPPEARIITDPAFSPHGDYVYFRRGNDSTGQFFDLYRIPVLGGAAQNAIHDVTAARRFRRETPSASSFSDSTTRRSANTIFSVPISRAAMKRSWWTRKCCPPRLSPGHPTPKFWPM